MQLKLFPKYGVLTEQPPFFLDTDGPTLADTVIEIEDASGTVVVSETPTLPIRWSMREHSRIRLEVDVLDSEGQLNPLFRWRERPTGARTSQYISWILCAPLPRWPPRVAGQSRILRGATVDYAIQVLLVTKPPDLKKGPIEWMPLQLHCVSGGLPELGKNR